MDVRLACTMQPRLSSSVSNVIKGIICKIKTTLHRLIINFLASLVKILRKMIPCLLVCIATPHPSARIARMPTTSLMSTQRISFARLVLQQFRAANSVTPL